MKYDRVAQQVVALSYRQKLQLAQLLISLATEERSQQDHTEQAPTTRQKLKAIDLDLQALAAALDPFPLADLAVAVDKLCTKHGDSVVAGELHRARSWVSKMKTIAKAVRSHTVAGALVSRSKVDDAEMAYHLCLIEKRSKQKAHELAETIDNQTRRTVVQAWEELK